MKPKVMRKLTAKQKPWVLIRVQRKDDIQPCFQCMTNFIGGPDMTVIRRFIDEVACQKELSVRRQC